MILFDYDSGLMNKKVLLAITLIVLFMYPTQAIVEYAPDQLAVIPGSYVSGATTLDLSVVLHPEFYVEYDTTIKIVEFVEYTDVEQKLVSIRLSYTIISYPESETYSAIGLQYDVDKLYWYHNRSTAIPVYYIKITNGSETVEANLMNEETFSDTSNLENMIIKLSDGREFNWITFLATSALEPIALTLRNMIIQEWEFSELINQKTDFCISPEANLGQKIDYGWFEGVVTDKSALSIEGDSTDTIKVHVDFTESPPIYSEYSMNMVIVQRESDYWYEAKTGLIVKFVQYNDTGYTIGQFIADEIQIGENGNTLTLPYDYLISIIGLSLMISLVIIHKKKK